VIVEEVEDFHVGAVGQCPVGDVESPTFVGLLGGEPQIAALGALVRLRVTNPRWLMIRQIVETAGLVPWRSSRWKAIVAAPAS
jgi:hypothetical protein